MVPYRGKLIMMSLIASCIIILLAPLTGGATSAMQTNYLLSCGSGGGGVDDTTNSSQRNRFWVPDNAFSDDFSDTVTASTATEDGVPEIPFSKARIFTSNHTYKFHVNPGHKFIRFFFFPSPSGYSSSLLKLSSPDSYLTVQVDSGQFLLRNFSAYLSARAKNYSFIRKEFYIHVNSSILRLTFSPPHPNSYAFINGIEVASVPENFYFGPASPVNMANPSRPFEFGGSTTPETLYRLNVGGRDIISVEDSGGGMYRAWESDDPYLNGNFSGMTGATGMASPIKYSAATPNYTAPSPVYETFRSMGDISGDLRTTKNLTWEFPVDLGLFYMLRLHWCELVVGMNKRVFDVYIDRQLAQQAVNVTGLSGGLYTPIYRDYVVYIHRPEGINTSTGLLQLTLHPNTQAHPRYSDVLLNGVEIFQINRSDGGVGHQTTLVPSTTITPWKQVSTKLTKSHRLLPYIIAFSIGSFLLVAFVFTFRLISAIKQRKTKDVAMSCHNCHQFSLAKLKLATNDFNEGLIIGHGGFGNVYRAIVQGDNNLVYKAAIKRLNPSSKQGAHEFKTEIQMLSKIRHLHLVSLLGYCNEKGEMILVYDYMEHGTLRDHLYNTNNTPLSWNQRLGICLGAAKGLHYLHAGVGQMIIHRDVKSTNILLDENWVPKVSDFGLSKLGPIGGDLHVSTAVKGSFGYMDPEYYMLQQLTEKSDVYSFGVVLFEVLCGRVAVDPNLPFEEVNVAMWARSFQKKGALDLIIDPNIKDEILPACLRTFGEIAERCVREHRTERPTMADVVWNLELAVELQQHGDIMSMMDNLSHNGVPSFLSQSTSFDVSDGGLSPNRVSPSHGEGIIAEDISS